MQASEDLFAKYTTKGFEPKTAAEYAMVENLDANIGRILAKLEALGLAQNTIVMFASDNGPNLGKVKTPRFNGGMRGAKGSLFEGGRRVPCVIRWPGTLSAGARVSLCRRHAVAAGRSRPGHRDPVDSPAPQGFGDALIMKPSPH